jgi:hypothetical protein
LGVSYMTTHHVQFRHIGHLALHSYVAQHGLHADAEVLVVAVDGRPESWFAAHAGLTPLPRLSFPACRRHAVHYLWPTAATSRDPAVTGRHWRPNWPSSSFTDIRRYEVAARKTVISRAGA